MEPLTVSDQAAPVIGFTLELDGDPNEIRRIMEAVWREMDQIRWDNEKLERLSPWDTDFGVSTDC